MLRTALSVGIFGLAAIAASACGGSSESSKPSTVTVTAQPTTTAQAGADWKYLKTQYAAVLGRDCGSNAAPDGVWAACAGLQNADMDSFYRDAQTLPTSKDRADLLKAIEDYKRDYGIWKQNMCTQSASATPGTASCITVPLQMSWERDTMVNLVNRNAGT